MGLRARHALEQRIHVDRLRVDFGDILDRRIHRDQVIAPGELRAVPRIVEKPDAFLLLQLGSERADRLDHLAARRVELQSHIEAHALQMIGDRFRVVRRVLQRHFPVFAVADDEREARYRVDRRQRIGNRIEALDRQGHQNRGDRALRYFLRQ